MFPWILLILAAACEMIWPIGFKYTNGFTRNIPLIGGTILIMTLSFILMMFAIRDHRIPVGTAYAVWTGLGTAGTAILGILMFNEPRNVGRLVCLSLVIIGVMGLKLFSPAPAASATTAQNQSVEK